MSSYAVRYKYRIYPTVEQEVDLARTFGCVRFVFNHALQESFDVLTERALQREQGVRYPGRRKAARMGRKHDRRWQHSTPR